MWFRVDDEFFDHEKVSCAAAALGGPRPVGRIAAVWLAAGTYSSRKLTDGLVPTVVVDGWLQLDSAPRKVMDAMVVGGLFVKDPGGYRFHDWLDYNPSGQEIKDKRAKDRDRKRASKPHSDRHGIHNGFRAESAPMSAESEREVIVESALLPRGILRSSMAESAMESAKESGVDSPGNSSRAGARAPRTPDPQDQNQESAAPAARHRPVEPVENLRALGKIAHVVADEIDAGVTPSLDRWEAIKEIAGKAGILYAGDRVDRVVMSADVQRKRVGKGVRR